MDRSQESPMDWQYSQPGGPSDINSPLHPRNIELQSEKARKRHLDALTSPTKNVPELAPPSSKPFLFSALNANLPSPPPAPAFKNQMFNTPRKFDAGIFSSDVEDSPVQNKMEEDTPEPPPKVARQKTAQTSIFANLTKRSGRGEVPRGKFSDAALKKVQKRRSRKDSINEFWSAGGSDSGDSSDDSLQRQRRKHRGQHPKQHGQFQQYPQQSWAETHRDIPTILSQYLQLGVNVSIACLGLYLLYAFVKTIQRDVEMKVQEYSAEVQHEIDICNKDWFANRCQPETLLPAMAEKCMEWKLCAERDPELIGRARVSAITFAEIINSFIEPISYKAMFFCFLLTFGCIFMSNFAFGFFRARNNNHPAPFVAAALPPIANHMNWASNEHYLAQNNIHSGFIPFPTPGSQKMGTNGAAGSDLNPTEQSTMKKLLSWK